MVGGIDYHYDTLKTCGVCDEVDTDGLEACSGCYGSVWADMVTFQETLASDAVLSVISALSIGITAHKEGIDHRVIYTARTNDEAGHGITQALAMADLLAKMILSQSETR